MKTCLALLLGLSVAASLRAQAPVSDPAPLRSPEQLDELLAPVALYPDPLVAILLPAATEPLDVVMAARYVAGGGDPAQIDNFQWDDSVKALTHYPDLLQWLNDNLEWATAVGEAFRDQSADVMASIQQLRAKAKAEGNLADTAQQQVVADDDNIRIMPAQTDNVYIPQYDPAVVYTESAPLGSPFVVFGSPLVVGGWLIYDCNWGHRGIWRHDWHPGWDWPSGTGQPWRPPPHRPRPRPVGPEPIGGRPIIRPVGPERVPRPVPHPKPMPGTPSEHSPGRPAPIHSGIITTPDRGDQRPGSQPPAPSGGTFSDYGRGSAARDASNRGATSRQTFTTPVPRPAPAPSAPVERPVSRPVSRPEPTSSHQSFTRQPSSSPGAFNVGNGGDAHSSSTRGNASRSGRQSQETKHR